jgi:hypothetical protein
MTDREQFEVWFYKRWPEFTNPTESAYEAWCAGAAAEREACAALIDEIVLTPWAAEAIRTRGET